MPPPNTAEAPPPRPAPQRPDLARAAALFDAGDYRSARAVLDALDPAQLEGADTDWHRDLRRGLDIDPGHLWFGAALLLIWAWLWVTVALG